jgi:hypothetical protein
MQSAVTVRAIVVNPAAGATAIVRRVQRGGGDDERLIRPPTKDAAVG